MVKRFVVVSGLPGSGKSTLARRIASGLDLPLIDKDDILERLFESGGAGDSARRRHLSRESDRILMDQAMASPAAVLVSFWHVPGMPPDSGTPTGWLSELAAPVVHVRCACSAELAAARFSERQRHPGHLDRGKSYAQVLESIRAVAQLAPLAIGECVDVDTSREAAWDGLLEEIRNAFRRCASRSDVV